MVSVIIPVYNVKKYLRDCIYSIVNGTFSDYELILVDDGSTDGSDELCDELQQQVMSSPVFKNPPQEFHVIHQENGGVSKARNTAIDTAQGEYVIFVDSDDTVEPDFLKKLYETAMEKEADFVFSDFLGIDVSGEKRTPGIKAPKNEAPDNRITKNETSDGKAPKDTRSKDKPGAQDISAPPVVKAEVVTSDEYHERLHSTDFVKYEVAWGKLFSKEFFADVRFEDNHIHEDAFIIHRLVDKAKKIVFLQDKLYCYYVRENSIMAEETQKTCKPGKANKTDNSGTTGKKINPVRSSDAMRALADRTEYYLEQKKYRFAFLAYNKFIGKLADYAGLTLDNKNNTELAEYYKHFLSAAKTLYERLNRNYSIPLGRKMYYRSLLWCPGIVSFAARKRHSRNSN